MGKNLGEWLQKGYVQEPHSQKWGVVWGQGEMGKETCRLNRRAEGGSKERKRRKRNGRRKLKVKKSGRGGSGRGSIRAVLEESKAQESRTPSELNKQLKREKERRGDTKASQEKKIIQCLFRPAQLEMLKKKEGKPEKQRLAQR